MTLHKLLSPNILDMAFHVRMKSTRVRFEIEVPDIDDEEESRVTLEYRLKVVNFRPLVIVTADGIEMLKEPLNGKVEFAVRAIWKAAEWHVLNLKKMKQNEKVRITERVNTQIHDLKNWINNEST